MLNPVPSPRGGGGSKQWFVQDALRLPIAQRLAPRKNKPGTLDLTASRLFIENIRAHAVVVQCASITEKTFPLGRGRIGLGPAVQLLLSSLFTLHRLWRQKTAFTDTDLSIYEATASKFGMIWCALGWILVNIYIHSSFSFLKLISFCLLHFVV